MPTRFPMQLPIGFEATFRGAVDLLERKAVIWEDDLGKEPKIIDIPEEFKAQAEEARAYMVEKIAELDDDLTMKYLEGQEITVPELKAALRKGVIANQAAPVFCWFFLKEQRRSGFAGCRYRLSAFSGRCPSRHGHGCRSGRAD